MGEDYRMKYVKEALDVVELIKLLTDLLVKELLKHSVRIAECKSQIIRFFILEGLFQKIVSRSFHNVGLRLFVLHFYLQIVFKGHLGTFEHFFFEQDMCLVLIVPPKLALPYPH